MECLGVSARCVCTHGHACACTSLTHTYSESVYLIAYFLTFMLKIFKPTGKLKKYRNDYLCALCPDSPWWHCCSVVFSSSLSVCLSLPLTPFPPTHTHTLFSVEQFDRKFQYHYTFTPKYFLCHESSKNKDILLRNHNAVTTPRKTNINTIVLEI